MPDNPTIAPRPMDWQDAEIASYRAPSVLALAALALGLVSFSAVYVPVLYAAPLAGVACGAAALWRIARNDFLLGRKAAIVGLLLSTLFAAAAPAHWWTVRWLLRSEARQVALAWFDFLRRGEPLQAFELTRNPTYRHALDDSIWEVYKQNVGLHQQVQQYVGPGRAGEGPRLVRTLLALGEKAEVRYFATDGQKQIGGVDTVYQVYAVTFGPADDRTTFFVGMELKRFLVPPANKASWQIVRADGGVRPVAYGGSPGGVAD